MLFMCNSLYCRLRWWFLLEYKTVTLALKQLQNINEGFNPTSLGGEVGGMKFKASATTIRGGGHIEDGFIPHSQHKNDLQ